MITTVRLRKIFANFGIERGVKKFYQKVNQSFQSKSGRYVWSMSLWSKWSVKFLTNNQVNLSKSSLKQLFRSCHHHLRLFQRWMGEFMNICEGDDHSSNFFGAPRHVSLWGCAKARGGWCGSDFIQSSATLAGKIA
jgi:hypothetical protein